MELKENLHKLLVLESIRKTGNKVPFPVEGKWLPLSEIIKDLLAEGWLSIDSEYIRITRNGKRTLIMFDALRKDFAKKLEAFKEIQVGGRVIDGRVAVESYSLRGKGKEVGDHLYAIAALLMWDDFFDIIKGMAKHHRAWQKGLFNTFDFHISNAASVDAWRMLGRNDKEAELVGDRLLGKVKTDKLVHIQRA